MIDPRLSSIAAEHPYPLVFATVSHAAGYETVRGTVSRRPHLYGFPSPDSDWDLRGVHVLPLRDVAGLDRGRDTIEIRLPYVPDLIARKVTGAEKSSIADADFAFHDAEFDRLAAVLEEAGAATHLPDAPSTRLALHDLLLRVRGC